jgi:hypothetical protein
MHQELGVESTGNATPFNTIVLSTSDREEVMCIKGRGPQGARYIQTRNRNLWMTSSLGRFLDGTCHNFRMRSSTFSTTPGSDVTTASFVTGALRELSVALDNRE